MITAVEPEVSNSLRLSFSVIVEPDGEEFYAHCPQFKGIHVDGKTEQEALNRAIEAVECYIRSLSDRNEALPVGAGVPRPRGTSRSRPRIQKVEVGWPSLQVCGTK